MIDLQNCLACGEAEVDEVQYDFIPKLDEPPKLNGRHATGWHYRNAYTKQLTTPSTKKRPLTSNRKIEAIQPINTRNKSFQESKITLVCDASPVQKIAY